MICSFDSTHISKDRLAKWLVRCAIDTMSPVVNPEMSDFCPSGIWVPTPKLYRHSKKSPLCGNSEAAENK